MLKFPDAVNQILSAITPLVEQKSIPLSNAKDQILAQSIASSINVPPFSNSAMDGYAVRIADLADSMTLPVATRILAGDNIEHLDWPAGTSLRIMTGAPIPKDTDAVVMQENVTLTAEGATFHALPKNQENIRQQGEDIHQGQTVLTAGTRLTIPMITLLASLGIDTVAVYKPLTVALFSTGDELKEIGQPLAAGQIYDTNRLTVKLMLNELGCRVIDLGLIPDQPDKVRQAFLDADQCADLVISSGGVSVGDADYTQQILNEIGDITFWKLAIKPGKPFAFGRLKNAYFCGLPGNPISAIVTFYQLVQPLLAKLAGDVNSPMPQTFTVKTRSRLKKSPGRLDFQRGILAPNASGELEVTSTGHQGSHMLHSLYQANCFILLEAERGSVEAGEWVTVSPFNQLLGGL